jgi:hypothetical protein
MKRALRPLLVWAITLLLSLAAHAVLSARMARTDFLASAIARLGETATLALPLFVLRVFLVCVVPVWGACAAVSAAIAVLARSKRYR